MKMKEIITKQAFKKINKILGKFHEGMTEKEQRMLLDEINLATKEAQNKINIFV